MTIEEKAVKCFASLSFFDKIKMVSSVTFLILGLHLIVGQGQYCEPPFRLIRNVCLHFPSIRKTWCDAQEYCSSAGGELVHGSKFLAISGSDSGLPHDYWIGMTDFLDERRENQSGWRWTDGAVEPPSSDLAWGAMQPNSSTDCVRRCFTSGICATPCPATHIPMCQSRPRATAVALQKYFKEVSIPIEPSPDDYAENGCFKPLVDITSYVKCAKLCSTEKPGWCVSFYFNKREKKCVLVLYTDAIIYPGPPEGWRKFVPKKPNS